jgi:hypothetical protein
MKKRLMALNIKDFKAAQLPDNVSLLNNIAAKGYIIKTPP